MEDCTGEFSGVRLFDSLWIWRGKKFCEAANVDNFIDRAKKLPLSRMRLTHSTHKQSPWHGHKIVSPSDIFESKVTHRPVQPRGLL